MSTLTAQPCGDLEDGPPEVECSAEDGRPSGDSDPDNLPEARTIAEALPGGALAGESDVLLYAVDIARERKHGS